MEFYGGPSDFELDLDAVCMYLTGFEGWPSLAFEPLGFALVNAERSSRALLRYFLRSCS